MLEGLANGNEKTPAVITDYKDYNTDKTVKFIVQMSQVSSSIYVFIYIDYVAKGWEFFI